MVRSGQKPHFGRKTMATEDQKAFIDQLRYGQSFMLDDKRIDPKDIYMDKQEPVAWMNKDGWIGLYKQGDATIPLYTAPPKREWVGLTDEEIVEAVGSPLDEVYLSDFRRVEAKLKEKNGF